MKKIYYLICAILLIALSSCNETVVVYNGGTPYDLGVYNLKQNVKSVKETIYDVKFVNKIAQKNNLLETTNYNYNIYGRLSQTRVTTGSNAAIISNYTYGVDNQKFLYSSGGASVMNNLIVDYDEHYNLVSMSYTDTDNLECVREFNYDENNNLIKDKLVKNLGNGNGSKVATTTTTYVNNIRTSFESIVPQVKGKPETVKYKCDKYDNVILEEIYDSGARTPKLKATFTYEYDKFGNWTRRVRKETYTKTITERAVSYYTDSEIAIAKESMAHENLYIAKTTVVDEPVVVDGFINNIIYKLTHSKTLGGPSTTLLVVVIVLTLLLSLWLIRKNKSKLAHFSGIAKANGMKRLWMYNSQPYTRVASYILLVLAGFLLSIVLLFLFGGGTWCFFWFLKICLIILIWVGVICTIIGGLALWAGSPYGLLLGIPGVIIWIYADDMEAAGNRLVANGFEFMNNLNMFQWGYNLFVNYWDVLVAIFVLPMILFSAFALLFIIISTTLNLSELLITKIYNVRRPCPVCGSTSGYHYLVEGKVHPVALRPGMYGILSHLSPINGSKLPTMLFNGKAKLDRECINCNAKVTAKMEGETNSSFGTDIHIGVVGHRSSGKSYLLYSGLSLLQSQYSDRLSQIDADNDTAIIAKKRRIDAGGDIQTDEKSKYRAIQLMLKDKFRAVPYHLFFYDVAGEKFNAASKAHLSAMDFYRNVDSILFVIDPLMVDFTGIPANDDLLNWIENKDKQGQNEKNNIGNTFTILKEILEKAGRKSKKIDFTFVCVKMDLGYFEAMNYDSNKITPKEVEQFICRDMSMNNVVNAAKAEFKSVNFAAVSATSKDTSSLNNLFVSTLKQKGVKL